MMCFPASGRTERYAPTSYYEKWIDFLWPVNPTLWLIDLKNTNCFLKHVYYLVKELHFILANLDQILWFNLVVNECCGRKGQDVQVLCNEIGKFSGQALTKGI